MSSRQLAAQASRARRLLRSSGIGFPDDGNKTFGEVGLAASHGPRCFRSTCLPIHSSGQTNRCAFGLPLNSGVRPPYQYAGLRQVQGALPALPTFRWLGTGDWAKVIATARGAGVITAAGASKQRHWLPDGSNGTFGRVGFVASHGQRCFRNSWLTIHLSALSNRCAFGVPLSSDAKWRKRTSLFFVTPLLRLRCGSIALSVALSLLQFPLGVFVVLSLLDFLSLVCLIHRYLLVAHGKPRVFQ